MAVIKNNLFKLVTITWGSATSAEALDQQMFFVRKRSVNNRCFLCENVASATWFCLRESEAAAATTRSKIK
ncbi:hypothetical protein [Lysinibacillus xylanilyticus]|uniref:hypothetical protein n=1 Tax=Lysinibacillus xylanilyticus TaxID=582475 RepID=UPI003D04B661